MICETRIGGVDDVPFVVDSWTKNDPELRAMRISEATRHVRSILAREHSRLFVAHVPGEPSAILGWAVLEQGTRACLHYVYVRSAARRQGVARALLGDAAPLALDYSHVAPRGVDVPSRWTLNLKRAETPNERTQQRPISP